MGVEYHCEGCGHRQKVEGRCRVYDVDYHERLNPIEWTCWCKRCEKVTYAEIVPPLELFYRELALIERNAPYEERLFTAQYNPEAEVVLMRAYIRWRESRVAPSKCQECGSQDIINPGSNYAEYPCPKCDLPMQVLLSVFGGTIRYEPDLYSTEGELIELGRQAISMFAK